MTTPIKALYGMEPLREGEFPTAHIVGSKTHRPDAPPFTVTRIERREENLGTYGLVWFDVYDGDRVACSMQATAVAEVYYQEPEAEE